MRKFNKGNKFTLSRRSPPVHRRLRHRRPGRRARFQRMDQHRPQRRRRLRFRGQRECGRAALLHQSRPFRGAGDIITLNSGGFAIGTDTSTIFIGTSNNTLYNFGTIAGAAGTDGGDGYKAIHLYSGGTLSNDVLFNHGLITGGAGAYKPAPMPGMAATPSILTRRPSTTAP